MFNKKTATIFVAAIIAFKSFLSATLELHPDEAYYWLWSQHLALGYYDHAPMIAYFIKLTTLFSNSEFFVRFSTIIATLILSILVWRFVKKNFNETIAAASIIILNTLPLMMAASIIITPDTPLFLFWAFAVYFLWKLSCTEETKYWYLTGLFFGLSLLSKYTGILFAPCLLIYMFIDKKLYWFKNKHFYFMFLTAFIIFIPVLLWNFQNDWISFTYQLKHGLHNPEPFNLLEVLSNIFEYIGGQMLIGGPLIFISGIVAAIAYLKNFKKADSKIHLIFSFSIPIFVFFFITAFKQKPGANWTAFAYFTFCIMISWYMLTELTSFKKNVLIIAIIINITASLIVGLHVKYAIIPVNKISEKAAIADATNWFSGWKLLGDDLLERDIKYVITHSHQWGSEIAYYTKGKIGTFLNNKRQNQFAYWEVPKDLETEKVAIVRIDNRMEDDFSTIEGADIITVKRHNIPVRQYAIIESEGYNI